MPPQRRLPDLNAIALRLCVRGYGNAQDAIQATHTKCGIRKVAAAGYNMFEAGLTIQTTFVDEATKTKHMYVPKYMSFALTQPLPHRGTGENQQLNQELDMSPNLSVLYQLLGRGFADTRGERLPANWRLNVLSRKGVRDIVKHYGNAELLLSRPKGESIEGRKLALGSLCASIENAPYDAIKTKWLGKKETSSGTTADMRRKYNLNYVLSMDVDDYRKKANRSLEVGQWPFWKMRKCLESRPATVAELTATEQLLERECTAFVQPKKEEEEEAPEAPGAEMNAALQEALEEGEEQQQEEVVLYTELERHESNIKTKGLLTGRDRKNSH